MKKIITILDGKGDTVLKLNDGDWVEVISNRGSTYRECHYISATQFRLGDDSVNYRLFGKQLSRGDLVLRRVEVVDNLNIPGIKLRTKTSIKAQISGLKHIRRHVEPNSVDDVYFDIKLEVLEHALYSSVYKLKLEYMAAVNAVNVALGYASDSELALLTGRVDTYEWVLGLKEDLPTDA